MTNSVDTNEPTGTPATLEHRYGSELRQFLSKRLLNREDASDVAQEIYLRLLRVGKAELALNCPAYLFTVAANVVHEFRIRATRQFVIFDSELVDAWDLSPTSSVGGRMDEELSLQRELRIALRELPATCRAVVLARKRDGMSHPEIAEHFGISIHTVHQYLSRGLAMLRKRKWDSDIGNGVRRTR